MKKTLIALAAVAAATGALAQSTVTISGNLDYAYATVSGTQASVKGSTISTTVGTSSTSVIRFIATEDLGGGMRATAQYNLDPRSLANDSLSISNNMSNANNGLDNRTTATGLARDEVFVGISGAFGNIRLGSPNSLGLVIHGVSSPLGTGVGSGYTGGTTAGTMTNSIVQTRYNRSIRYDSPSFNGLTVHALYAPGNDEPAATGTNALLIPNARQATEFAVVYAQGPLTVGYALVQQAKQTNKLGFYGVDMTGTATAAADKTSASLLSVNYRIGNTTLAAGFNTGDRLARNTDGKAVDSKGQRVAVSHTMGQVALMASYSTQTAKSGTAGAEVKAKVTGLRADYNLSKRSAAYFGYEKYDTGAATANTRKIVSVGVRHSF
jgi:predicted porin